MRHRKNTVKLGRTSEHRKAMLSGMVCNLITAKRITTTLPKARAARRLAERMVTQAKKGTQKTWSHVITNLHRRRPALELYNTVAPAFQDRAGGYTRIVKLGRRASDGSEMAILEWVNYIPPAPKKKAKKEKTDEKK